MNWRSKKVTDRQLEVMDELGIAVPPDCSRGEASRLIGLAYNGPAHPVYVEIADELGIDTRDLRSRDDLLDLIAADILAAGREPAMCQWYAYRVYRRHIGHRRTDAHGEFTHPAVLAAADALMEDPRAVESVRRSIEQGGLMQFSMNPDSDASASTNTIAYRTALRSIRELADRKPSRPAGSRLPAYRVESKPIPFPKDLDGRYAARSSEPRRVTPGQSAPGPQIPDAWTSQQSAAKPLRKRARRAPDLESKIGEIPAGMALWGAIAILAVVLAYAIFG